MNRPLLVLLSVMFFSNLAHAVSIEFETYKARSIEGPVTNKEEGTETTTLNFEGQNLKAFMNSLPMVVDNEGDPVPLNPFRGVRIFGKDKETGKTTVIYLTCEVEKPGRSPKCKVTLQKGDLAG